MPLFDDYVKTLPLKDREIALKWASGKPDKERKALREALAKVCFRLKEKILEIKKRGKNGKEG